jgi:hypothetical protein
LVPEDSIAFYTISFGILTPKTDLSRGGIALFAIGVTLILSYFGSRSKVRIAIESNRLILKSTFVSLSALSLWIMATPDNYFEGVGLSLRWGAVIAMAGGICLPVISEQIGIPKI